MLLNIVLSDGAVSAMRDRLKETGRSVITTQIYANMEDYESIDDFLKRGWEFQVFKK